MSSAAGYDEQAFVALQERLVPMWPGMTIRTHEATSRAIFVVSSISFDVPTHMTPVLPAYEERYLFMVLALARSRNAQVIYVTSSPMLPRLVDYYLDMTAGIDASELRKRLRVVSVGDPSPRPLTAKILDRPLLVERLRGMAEGYDHALLIPFMTTPLEVQLALRLDVPIYGPSPSLAHLGTKTGSRAAFAAAGVPMPRGVSGVRDRADIMSAIHELYVEEATGRFVVKTDAGAGGLGNAFVDVKSGSAPDIARAVDALTPSDPDITREQFLVDLAVGSGVVEEWVTGEEVVSPSVQLRASPFGDVEVLSTHDQLLGGRGGLTFLGCRFPAAAPFIEPLTRHGRAIGQELARHGVIGRFAIDFVMVRRGDTWHPFAIEINLRNGGTTHPLLTLLALTDGEYDEDSGQLITATGPKRYVATDHVERPEYRHLTPDDVLDLVTDSKLGWNDQTQTGVALHMVSAVASGGRLGATAIANEHEQAQSLYDRVGRCLDVATGAASP